jgi:hypothetical protein
MPMGEARRRKQTLEREEQEYERLSFFRKIFEAFRAFPTWSYALLVAAIGLAGGLSLREVLTALLS